MSSLLAAYLTNPLHPIPPHATQPPETLAQLAAFGSPELVKRAVGSALNHNFRMGGTPEWANQQPTMVEGPYLCLPSPSNDGSAQAKDLPPATLHGPMDPKLLAPSTVVAVYYACFAMPARSSPQEGYSLDPSLAAPRHYEGQSAQSQSIPVDQGATAQTRPILGTPASGGGPDPYRRPEVDMSARQRAPRKCGVCGQYYCKGASVSSLPRPSGALTSPIRAQVAATVHFAPNTILGAPRPRQRVRWEFAIWQQKATSRFRLTLIGRPATIPFRNRHTTSEPRAMPTCYMPGTPLHIARTGQATPALSKSEARTAAQCRYRARPHASAGPGIVASASSLAASATATGASRISRARPQAEACNT